MKLTSENNSIIHVYATPSQFHLNIQINLTSQSNNIVNVYTSPFYFILIFKVLQNYSSPFVNNQKESVRGRWRNNINDKNIVIQTVYTPCMINNKCHISIEIMMSFGNNKYHDAWCIMQYAIRQLRKKIGHKGFHKRYKPKL